MPHGYTFKEHESVRGFACLVTKLDSESLHDVIEQMLGMKEKDI